jgi:hypothetical protein
MTKKDYIKAAKIVSEMRVSANSTSRTIGPNQRLYEENVSVELEDVFIRFFRDDNPRFDEKRFRQACKENT